MTSSLLGRPAVDRFILFVLLALLLSRDADCVPRDPDLGFLFFAKDTLDFLA